jgi:hypothetical protein
MPFDNTNNTLALVETPDLSVPSLAGLAWVLRHKEAWPPGHIWSFARGATCAVGIGHRRWEVNVIDADIGLSRRHREYMFCYGAYAPVADCDVTPEMVADRIDAYLARGR